MGLRISALIHGCALTEIREFEFDLFRILSLGFSWLKESFSFYMLATKHGKRKREYIQSGSGVNPLFYAPNCKWTRQQFTKEWKTKPQRIKSPKPNFSRNPPERIHPPTATIEYIKKTLQKLPNLLTAINL